MSRMLTAVGLPADAPPRTDAHRAGRPLRPAPLPFPVRGVLFEMCNVLYDNTVWRRWLLRLLSHFGLHTNYHSFYRIWDRDFLDEVHRGKQEFCAALTAFLLSAGLSPGQIQEIEAASRAKRRALQDTTPPLPGVKATLAALYQSELVLGAVVNSEYPTPFLRGKLDRFALGRLFSVLVSSIELERTMPDAACYRTALAAMDLPPEEVVFVGHDTSELAGAAAVGMPTIAINYDPDARADIYLTRLEDLLDVVKRPLRQAAAA